MKRTIKPTNSAQRTGRSRAKTAQAKSDLRATFIAAGRALLCENGSKEASLRSIAAAAGYSPGTLYQYFADYRSLLLAIREEDMLSAVIAFERLASNETDPRERVIRVFIGVARYWLYNFDQYQSLFSLSPYKQPVRTAEGVPFGRSTVVSRSYSLYDRIVRDLLEADGATSINPKCAVDSLIAAVHGIVSFPIYTRTMAWTDTLEMVEFVVRSLVMSWRHASGSANQSTR
ncbi:TetR/AcrR family transcriptional regulator [Bradyrhizobium tropiciagri]|uniref:TetR/AcrR family transcriptional regulator n=1 Tax=Bradyrhizobium tropiciagri TaxID=312253 RepID=UPI001BA7C453|nr:TetR/AcrR family transcriptional regulator [Bradyrhizobium tropiciagri]MBR0896710.1 TetR/AcrR family transcriptional regulator [Bradyrhizobium tropiciagri]